MLYPVEKLLENRDPPLCVGEGDTVRDALVHMVANDYSQLPIVDQGGNLVGLISEQSISRNYYHLGE
jgi:CBS domain-containing protein